MDRARVSLFVLLVVLVFEIPVHPGGNEDEFVHPWSALIEERNALDVFLYGRPTYEFEDGTVIPGMNGVLWWNRSQERNWIGPAF